MTHLAVEPMGRPGSAGGGLLAAALAAALSVLAPGTALAYWSLRPEANAGIITEENPRFTESGGKTVMGTFTDARAFLSLQTPTSLLRLAPQVRKTNYLGANKDLNDDNVYLDLVATHQAGRGQVGLSMGYREVAIRTGEFEGATPDDPDANPIPGGGGGRLRDPSEEQETLVASPFISYSLSPRNSLQLSGNLARTDYDAGLDSGYFDYTSSSVGLSLTHALNPKNAFRLSLSAGTFDAEQASTALESNSDSYSLNLGYERAITLTWSGDVSVGTSRSTVTTLNPNSFNPDTGIPCFPVACRVTDQNFIGDLSLRRRAERSTVNFSVGRALAPRSDGTEVVQDQFRVYFDQRLTRRLSGTIAFVYLDETTVADIFRRQREYFTIDNRLTWQLTGNWSVYGTYSYTDNTDQDNFDSDIDKSNNRFFFGVSWRGTPIQW